MQIKQGQVAPHEAEAAGWFSLLGALLGVTIMGVSCLLVVVGITLFIPSLWKLNLVWGQ